MFRVMIVTPGPIPPVDKICNSWGEVEDFMRQEDERAIAIGTEVIAIVSRIGPNTSN